MSVCRWEVGLTLQTVRGVITVYRWEVGLTLYRLSWVSCLSTGEWLVGHNKLSRVSCLSADVQTDWDIMYVFMWRCCMKITRDCQGYYACLLMNRVDVHNRLSVSVIISVHSVNTSDNTKIYFQDPANSNRMYPISFLCPNGTIFNQEIFTCEWW